MRRAAILALAIVAAGGLAAQQSDRSDHSASIGGPQFVSGNRLDRPQNYREWIYLSSGLGMAYSPKPNTPPAFTNVFVEPGAYGAFLATGHWPDKTMFVLEERASSSVGSINKSGHFQTELQGLAVSVKDESRFPEKWAYFSFSVDQESAVANPKSACWQCHNDHGAVNNTFVQFYPTLKPVAAKFGTYKPKD
jgi:hypothetical protein